MGLFPQLYFPEYFLTKYVLKKFYLDKGAIIKLWVTKKECIT